VLEAMRQRDLLDSSRETSPLTPAPDSIIIDSTHRPVEDILDQLEPIITRLHSAQVETQH
jgi:cytidylate kinase